MEQVAGSLGRFRHATQRLVDWSLIPRRPELPNPRLLGFDLLLVDARRKLGENIKRYCPNAEFVVIIFNPADITGLTTLVHGGLQPGRVSTLAALDSTRLQTKLAQHFAIAQDEVTGCTTYGGHGEKTRVRGVSGSQI